MSAILMLSSCLKDNESTTTYPSDAAITGFSLGNLKRYTTVKATNGSDSTAVTVVSGSTYKFYIDQIARTIYNPDSLPYGIDAKHMLCTITSKNSGIITLKSISSDTLTYYNSEDSLDFSVPRTIQVNSLDGANSARYTVQVNIHQEPADTFLWTNTSTVEAFAQARAMKAITLGDKVFVFVSDGQQCHVYSSPQTDNDTWTLENQYRPLPATAWKNVVVMDDQMYVYAGGRILSSDDGRNWAVGEQAFLTQLVAAGSYTLYALGEGGQLLASDDEGRTWQVETLDDSGLLLPTSELSCCLTTSRINEHVETVSIIGNRSVSEYDEDSSAQVWSKVEDPLDDQHADHWMYITDRNMPQWSLPRLASLTTIAYGNGLLAAGANGLGSCTEAGFQGFYYSNNGGLYWSKSSVYKMPKGFECNDVFTMTADSSQRLYLICGGTGKVWRGRMSGAAADVQKSYTY